MLGRLSYRSLQWLVFLCLALHNLEEGLTMGAYLPRVRETLRQSTSPAMLELLPGVEQFHVGLVWATLLPLALTVIATTGRQAAYKPYLVAAIAAVLLVNVFVPHVPAAVALGGYSPGLATAVLVNLPFSIYFLRRSVREGRIGRRGLAGIVVVALAVVLLGLPLLFTLLW